MKPVELIGVNGDQITLTGEICVGIEAKIGSARPRISYRSTSYGRRIETLRQDVIVSEFNILVTGATPLIHDQNRARVLAALRSPQSVRSASVVFVVERDDGSRRAQLGFDLGDDEPIRDGMVRRSTIPVVLESVEDPYWQALEAQVHTTTIGVSTSTPWVGEMPIGAAVDIGWAWDIGGYFIPDAGSQTLTIVNEGGINTWPIWQITGPASTLVLGHERTGLVTSWAGTLLQNEILEIVTDPRKRAVTIGTANAWSGIALESVMSPLLPASNKVQVGLTGGVTGQTEVQVTSYSRFVSA